MSNRELSASWKAAALLAVLILVVAILGVGLLLRRHGPGNMGNGLLWGAGAGLLVAGAMLRRTSRRPQQATVFERAFTRPATSGTTPC